jgi:hypothetical protein
MYRTAKIGMSIDEKSIAKYVVIYMGFEPPEFLYNTDVIPSEFNKFPEH